MLKPNKSIYVLQGQSGEITCEAEGPSVSTLKWEKQQDDKSYAAVPNSQVNITKDANYVRATLKITNAQFADTGTYKCTVSVPPNLSDYKLTKIEVKGMLALYFIVKITCMHALLLLVSHHFCNTWPSGQHIRLTIRLSPVHVLLWLAEFVFGLPNINSLAMLFQLVGSCQLGFSILLCSIWVIILFPIKLRVECL